MTDRKKDRPGLLVICLLISIILHLLAVYILQQKQLTKKDPDASKPTFVRLIDKPTPPKQVDLEIDQQPTLPEEQPTEETNRIAERSQRVEKEQAPKGTDERDQAKTSAAPPAPPSPPTPAPQVAPAPPKPPQPTTETVPKAAAKEPPPTKTGKLPAHPEQAVEETPQQQDTEDPPRNFPSLQQLTQLSPETLNRSIASGRSQREKIKQRDDVAEGDTVWLNLERGLLISFFRRFRNAIEGVWNYPPDAARQGVEGTLLMKITINRNGELFDAEVMRGSGSDTLDMAAIQAVYAAEPFGPLPRQFPHPQLKVMAHFRYELTGKNIYGRNR